MSDRWDNNSRETAMHREADWLCGVMVSTGDFESPNLGSIPGMTL